MTNIKYINAQTLTLSMLMESGINFEAISEATCLVPSTYKSTVISLQHDFSPDNLAKVTAESEQLRSHGLYDFFLHAKRCYSLRHPGVYWPAGPVARLFRWWFDHCPEDVALFKSVISLPQHYINCTATPYAICRYLSLVQRDGIIFDRRIRQKADTLPIPMNIHIGDVDTALTYASTNVMLPDGVLVFGPAEPYQTDYQVTLHHEYPYVLYVNYNQEAYVHALTDDNQWNHDRYPAVNHPEPPNLRRELKRIKELMK